MRDIIGRVLVLTGLALSAIGAYYLGASRPIAAGLAIGAAWALLTAASALQPPGRWTA